jgi:hypothetical protein
MRELVDSLIGQHLQERKHFDDQRILVVGWSGGDSNFHSEFQVASLLLGYCILLPSHFVFVYSVYSSLR